MSTDTTTLSELPRSPTPVNPADLLLISKGTTTSTGSYSITLEDLQKVIFKELAFITVGEGITGTTQNQTFYVFTDATANFVYAYLNLGSNTYRIVDANGAAKVYPTTNLFSQLNGPYGLNVLKEVDSFVALRTLPVTTEGQKVKLASYFSGTGMGGGEFIGHLGVATDDGGTIAAGSGYYWERTDSSILTPAMFGALGDGVSDDSAALLRLDTACTLLGIALNGNDATYAIGAYLTLRSGDINNIKFVPASGFVGGGPEFVCNQTTGVLILHNVQASGFIARGAVAQRSNYSSTPSILFSGVCKFNNNGGRNRTNTTAIVNTVTDFVIPVVSTATFSPDNYVWIGDSKCRILSVDSATQITLYNNGTGPTTFSGGTGTGTYAANQYVTVDGNGKNGFVINPTGGSGWKIVFEGDIEFNDNGWAGLFHYTNAYNGYVYGGAKASRNGYVGLGLGYITGGEIHGGYFSENGNNGLDIFQCDGNLKVHDNVSINNGVDGMFTGSTGTAPRITNNTCSNNFRIGILNFGRTVPPDGNVTMGNTCLNNGSIGICNTAIGSSVIYGNLVGGSDKGIKVEGKDGLTNPASTVIESNQFVLPNGTQDIYAVIGGYVSGGNFGAIKLLNNNYFGRNAVVSVSGHDQQLSKFSPRGRVNTSLSLTATAGSNIPVSFSFNKMTNTTLIDPTAGLVELQFGGQSGLTAIATPDAAQRTAGVELSNTALTNGHILVYAAFGAFSYNFISNTPRTLYLMYKSEYGDGVITLSWT